jgi:hypothetical protein
MPLKLPSLQKRLGRIEQALSHRANKIQLADCICSSLTITYNSEELKAETEQVCPVHGFRDLGRVINIRSVAADSAPESEKEECRRKKQLTDQLLGEYERRKVAWKKSLVAARKEAEGKA